MASNYYTVIGNVTKTVSGKPGFQINEMMLIEDKVWEKMRYDKGQQIKFLKNKYPDIADIDDGFGIRRSIPSEFKAYGVANPNAKNKAAGEKKDGAIKGFFKGLLKKVMTTIIGLIILYIIAKVTSIL